MFARTVLATGFMWALCIGCASAQSTTAPAVTPADTAAPARNPVLGSPAPAPDVVRAPDAPARAADTAASDKQPPGTQNGNQPDRAAAGGGSR